jgi:hypothetical protein
MFRHFISFTIRKLMLNKGYFIIDLLGLAVGINCLITFSLISFKNPMPG